MRPSYVRELTHYPVGRRRLRYLLMAVLASLILNFEGQISPVVPLLLDDLDMSLETYGLIGAVAVAAGAISAAIGGRLADQWGRTALLVPTLFVTALCDFATAFVSSPAQLLVVRSVLLFAAGAAITTTAGLVRDFSPRLGRATAFGFWTWGPIGANFLAAGIAGATLPIFVTWRSQFIIIGSIALVCSILIAIFIADLSPQLRARVISTEAELSKVDAAMAEEVHLGGAAAVPLPADVGPPRRDHPLGGLLLDHADLRADHPRPGLRHVGQPRRRDHRCRLGRESARPVRRRLALGPPPDA